MFGLFYFFLFVVINDFICFPAVLSKFAVANYWFHFEHRMHFVLVKMKYDLPIFILTSLNGLANINAIELCNVTLGEKADALLNLHQ